MKEYCVDLKIAKKLKENGFPQKIERFSWRSSWINSLVGKEHYYSFGYHLKSDIFEIERYYAPSSDELLKELPNEIKGYILEIIRYEDGTIEADYTRNLQYENDKEYLIQSNKLFYKSSDSLADLWLDLKKEGYIK